MMADGLWAPLRNLDFMRMALDLYEEMRLRKLFRPDMKRLTAHSAQRAKRLVDESWCSKPEWIAASAAARQSYFPPPTMLFKFGQPGHMRDLHERGLMWISPASSFGDLLNDNARRDDELEMNWTDQAGKRHTLAVTDYFCYCCASVYDYRLFWDFAKDEMTPAGACVAIKDIDSFLQRVRVGVARHNAEYPDRKIAQVGCCPVFYYDPLRITDNPNTYGDADKIQMVLLSKHFRYAYQWEFRFVLLPDHDGPLKHFLLDVGPLQDIAELIVHPAA